jgi:hypothetical protein
VVDIRQIRVWNVRVPDVPDWAIAVPNSIPLAMPVTQDLVTGQIGFPIVDIPGCVEARETSGNNNLIEDDPWGNLILCDGTQPVFPTFDYNANNLEPVIPAAKNVQLPPPLDQPKSESQSTDDQSTGGDMSGFGGDPPPTPPPTTPLPPATPSCPRPDDPPIGSKGKFGTKRVESYELNEDGECVTNWISEKPQDIAFTYLPPPPVALTTGAVAAVAVTSSVLMKPLSDYLLKLVKPLVKKTLKKVLPRLLKKKPKVLSLRERRLEQRNSKK